MTIRLGKDQVSMMNPPQDTDTVLGKDGREWRIIRTGAGMIMLAIGRGSERVIHSDFEPMGMGMLGFCCWINEQFE